MWKWIRTFSFERESYWMLVLSLVIPFVLLLVFIVLPGLARSLGW